MSDVGLAYLRFCRREHRELVCGLLCGAERPDFPEDVPDVDREVFLATERVPTPSECIELEQRELLLGFDEDAASAQAALGRLAALVPTEHAAWLSDVGDGSLVLDSLDGARFREAITFRLVGNRATEVSTLPGLAGSLLDGVISAAVDGDTLAALIEFGRAWPTNDAPAS